MPNSGDRVSFKKILIPPKLLKYQAVHVKLISLTKGPHEHWEDTRQSWKERKRGEEKEAAAATAAFVTKWNVFIAASD